MHPAASRALFEENAQHLTAALAERRGWTLHTVAYPLIDCSFSAPERTTLRVRLTCDDWNDRSPAITLHSAGGAFLTSPIRGNPSNVFHPDRHPGTGQFFICMRGSREYHTHPSHLTDPWESLKSLESYTLGGILTQVWNAWQKGRD